MSTMVMVSIAGAVTIVAVLPRCTWEMAAARVTPILIHPPTAESGTVRMRVEDVRTAEAAEPLRAQLASAGITVGSG
jgi:hypothetical protein